MRPTPMKESSAFWGHALCLNCGFPLEKRQIHKRLHSSTQPLTEAFWIQPFSPTLNKLTVNDALGIIDQMINSPIIPIFEGTTFVIFDMCGDSLVFNFG